MTAELGTIHSTRQEEFVGKERRVTFTTLSPGVLCVGAALPDPPFELVDGETPTGFDVELMRAICAELGLEWRLAHYAGKDFNRIFDGLSSGSWDSGVSVRLDKDGLRQAINEAQARLRANGELGRLVRKWLPA